MQIKAIIDEDFVNYKKPSMFIGTCYCDFKCCKEGNFDISVCQNSPMMKQKEINITIENLVQRYINNPITNAVVFGGMECMIQFEDIFCFIKTLRETHKDDVILYTGYYKEEIKDEINKLKQFENIIIKYGRYIPKNNTHFDNVLGVNLASDNQYAERIS